MKGDGNTMGQGRYFQIICGIDQDAAGTRDPATQPSFERLREGGPMANASKSRILGFHHNIGTADRGRDHIC